MGKRSKRRKDRDFNISDVEILNNNYNENEDPYRRQKKLLTHTFQLKHVKPITKNQEKAFRSYFEGKNLVLHGLAGTGKTYIAAYLGLNDLIKGVYKRIVIVRSAVSSRDVGFLPGTLTEKMSMYEQPYKDIFKDLLGKPDAYDLLKKKENLIFMSTSFVRGLTLDDALIIIDEIQNLSDHEINSVLTRVGKNSKVIVCGDFLQNDLTSQTRGKIQESGILSMIACAKKMNDHFDIIEFTIDDIVRSGFVRDYILTRYQLNLK